MSISDEVIGFKCLHSYHKRCLGETIVCAVCEDLLPQFQPNIIPAVCFILLFASEFFFNF